MESGWSHRALFIDNISVLRCNQLFLLRCAINPVLRGDTGSSAHWDDISGGPAWTGGAPPGLSPGQKLSGWGWLAQESPAGQWFALQLGMDVVSPVLPCLGLASSRSSVLYCEEVKIIA